ncbi:MAG: response regulator [Lachnospiraceae bacterium]|jgi:hemerythrin-like metal-binding protein|nr:response regulator [Lachnospiraceae bacterium]
MNDQKFVWHDRYNIGVDVIDREHKKLFSIMNKLFSYDENDSKSRWAYQEGIKFFRGHAMKHFAEEEMYMASIGYEGYDTHRRLHDVFRKKTLPEIEKELMATHYSPEAVEHFLGVCAGWLIGHTMTEDRAITGTVSSRWIDLLPEEEQAAIKKAITQQLYELFQLDAKVISESYGGEKFGNGIYYRLLYSSEKGKKYEFLLVFEERLLVETVGDLVESDADKVNVMMMNATRYIAKQFIGRIISHFPSMDNLELKEENLLSYKQFDRMFDQHNPQCSLLFDTGKGYFAYCMLAPDFQEDSLPPSICAENAMEEILKYLNENDAENVEKKKLLIVDDSALILQVMKELFDKDYDVTTAKSGVAAIRSMTLNAPDLVLLDYEMPVCNGKQVLEMIRAEEAFVDTPVIFLTGTVDKERLKALLPLKPAGYLLKTTRPPEIKVTVDEFFEKQAQV